MRYINFTQIYKFWWKDFQTWVLEKSKYNNLRATLENIEVLDISYLHKKFRKLAARTNMF